MQIPRAHCLSEIASHAHFLRLSACAQPQCVAFARTAAGPFVRPAMKINIFIYLAEHKRAISESETLSGFIFQPRQRNSNSEAPTKEHQQLNCVHAAHHGGTKIWYVPINCVECAAQVHSLMVWRASQSEHQCSHARHTVSGWCCSIKISRFPSGPLVIIIISPPPSAVFCRIKRVYTHALSKSVVQGSYMLASFLYKRLTNVLCTSVSVI